MPPTTEIPDEWTKLQELLEDCRFNFAAVSNPEELPEWKYLRVSDSVQSWSKLASEVGEYTRLTDESNRVWVQNDAEGFVQAELLEKGEKQSKIFYLREEQSVATDKIQMPNPSSFDGCEDMAMLSCLNEASVLHNLKERFKHNLIHTYSGLFCIVVNPWRWLPIYSPKIVLVYKGQTMSTMPPHIYAIGDNVYNSMMEGDEDQSILITGESGAGKTENTKKIIQYFTIVAAQKGTAGNISLEEQICESNPVLEAFGNAKSAHNDNSSRFGKFIRLCFSANGKVCKAVIDSYLLEKSRLISQAYNERSYHIFYQLLSDGASQELREELFLTGEAKEYAYLSQGMSFIKDIDDAEEMKCTERALKILNFTEDERMNMYRMTAASLLMGQMKFKGKHRNDDQAAVESLTGVENVCTLLGIDPTQFVADLIEPRIMIRGKAVKQGRSVIQVHFSVGALAKAVYEKQFRWLVKRCNTTLMSETSKRGRPWHFIGILDIAGFEIFESNSFEQLCINYTNEKLQFFFNHQMFVREQDEYRLEGLTWEMMDFALDLQPTINLIDRPMGIFSMLEEECIMPKGSDKNFVDKLNDQHLKKTEVYGRPKGGPKADAHFSVIHYAGMVNYNADNWLDKNKDPLNACVVQLFKESKNELLNKIWNFYGTTGFKSDEEAGEAPPPKPKQPKKRASTAFLTVSAVFKEQLINLISVLNATHPHFVRCVVPNYERKPGKINGPLVLHQLKCNGVLEGLRIIARGFPNRLLYEDFRNRFRILSPEKADWDLDSRAASITICDEIDLKRGDEYDLGMTKMFFRVGVLSRLELMRASKLNSAITGFQAQILWYNEIYKWKRQELYKEYVLLIQRNTRYWLKLRQWPWYKLMLDIKPAVNNSIDLMRMRLEEMEKAKNALEKELAEALKEQERLRAEQSEKAQKELEELRRQLEEERRKNEELMKQKAQVQETVVNDLGGPLGSAGGFGAMMGQVGSVAVAGSTPQQAAMVEAGQNAANLLSQLEGVGTEDAAVELLNQYGIQLNKASDEEEGALAMEMLNEIDDWMSDPEMRALLNQLSQLLTDSGEDDSQAETIVEQLQSSILDGSAEKNVARTKELMDKLGALTSNSTSSAAKAQQLIENLSKVLDSRGQLNDQTRGLLDKMRKMLARQMDAGSRLSDLLLNFRTLWSERGLKNRESALSALNHCSSLLSSRIGTCRQVRDLLKVLRGLLLSGSPDLHHIRSLIAEMPHPLHSFGELLRKHKARDGYSLLQLLSPQQWAKLGGSLIDLLRKKIQQQLSGIIARQQAALAKSRPIHGPRRKLTEKEIMDLLNKDIDKMSIEELRELAHSFKDLMRQKENDIGDLRRKLEDNALALKDKDKALNRKDDEIAQLLEKISRLERKLAAEAEENREREQEMRRQQRQTQETRQTAEAQRSQFTNEIDLLRQKQEHMDKTFRALNDQLQDGRIAQEKLQHENKTIRTKLLDMESALQEEKMGRRHAEREAEHLREEYKAMEQKVDKLSRQLEEQRREALLKDEELERLREQLDKLARLHAEELRDLKERHAALIEQLQNKYDQLHRKALKLESENQQLKAQIYNEPRLPVRSEERHERAISSESFGTGLTTSFSSRRSTRSAMGNMESSIIAVKIEDLERQKSELTDDKRIMRGEIESYAKTMENAIEERETLTSQLKAARLDLSRTNRKMALEIEEKQTLSAELRVLKNEIILQEQRADSEHMRALVKRGETSAHKDATEGLRSALTEQIETYRRAMERAQQTMTDLEQSPHSFED